jgi:hypothetical protein
VTVAHTEGEGVFLSRTPGPGNRIRAYLDGTRLVVRGPAEQSDGQRWLPVLAPDGLEGWVPEQYTEPLGARAGSQAAPTRAPAATSTPTTAPTRPPAPTPTLIVIDTPTSAATETPEAEATPAAVETPGAEPTASPTRTLIPG